MPCILTALLMALASCSDPMSPSEELTGGRIYLTTISPPVLSESNMRGIVVTRDGAIVREFDSVVFEVRPRGGTMVYRRLRDMTRWASRIDGSSPQQLTCDSFLMFMQYPVLSPDGRLLAYTDIDTSTDTSPGSRTCNVVTERTDGNGRDILARNVSCEADVAFSPDGRHIAYIGVNRELYSISVTGGHPQPLGRIEYEFDSLWTLMGIKPEWSPDGSRVLVNTNRFGLAIFPFDGSMAGREPESFLLRQQPPGAWSPDGTRIATADGRAIVILDTNLVVVKRFKDVTEGAADMLQWSPDSRSLLFIDFGQAFLIGRASVLDVGTGTKHTLSENCVTAFWEQ